MTRIELSATVRQESGKGVSRRLRANKMIPAVIYGRGEKSLQVAVDPITLKKAINTPKKLNTILTLKLDDGAEHTVLVKDFQTDVVSHELLHADFLDVKLDQKVVVKVPVAYVGHPIGVVEGGVLQTLRRELEVLALPAEIPERLDVDVSHMRIGASLHVKDVQTPPGITVRYSHNFAIAGIVSPEKEEGPGAAASAEAAAAKK